MAYIPTTWVNTTNPALNAANLNKLEQAVQNAHAGYEAAQTTANAAQSSATTALATANAAGANANAAVVTANAASALATSVGNEVAAARGASIDLDTRLDGIDAAIAAGSGGATVTNAKLLEWFDEFYQKIRAMLPIGTPLTYRADLPEIVATANVTWPDGSAGVYTLTAINLYWEAETAWTITHAASAKTVTQSAITINAATGVESKPTPTVA